MRIEKAVIPNQVVYYVSRNLSTFEERIPHVRYELNEKLSSNNGWYAIAEISTSTKFRDLNEVLVENEPRKYKMVNSGAQFSLQDSENRVFQVDPYILISAMKKGIDTNGVLNSEFIWVLIEKTMKLVDVDSEIFNLLLEANNRNIRGIIAKKHIKPGRVYQNASGGRFLALDHVCSMQWREKWNDQNKNYELCVENEKHTLVLALDQKTTDITKYIEEKLANTSQLHRFGIVKPKFVIEEEGLVAVPKELNSKIRELSTLNFEEKLKDVKIYIAKSRHWVRSQLPLMSFRGINEPNPLITNSFLNDLIAKVNSKEKIFNFDVIIAKYRNELKNKSEV